jgi:phosphoribosylformylglycinamidine synthase
MGDACRALETPVTGGNVSFYNQSPDGAIYPTPTIGMLGILDDIDCAVAGAFKDEGDAIILLTAYEGENATDGIGGSEYLSLCKNGAALGNAPSVDLAGEARLINMLVGCAERKLLNSAHDISDGGLAVTLAESCMSGMIGAAIEPSEYARKDVYLFAERQGRVVISAAPDCVVEIFRLAEKNNVKAEVIGSVGGKNLSIEGLLDEPVDELRAIYESAIPNLVDAVVEL